MVLANIEDDGHVAARGKPSAIIENAGPKPIPDWPRTLYGCKMNIIFTTNEVMAFDWKEDGWHVIFKDINGKKLEEEVYDTVTEEVGILTGEKALTFSDSTGKNTDYIIPYSAIRTITTNKPVYRPRDVDVDEDR